MLVSACEIKHPTGGSLKIIISHVPQKTSFDKFCLGNCCSQIQQAAQSLSDKVGPCFEVVATMVSSSQLYHQKC